MKITLLIVTLNEVDGMKAIMPRIKTEWYDQLIILDGGSTDGTLEYAKEQGYFTFVQTKPGIRDAYLEVLPHVEGDVLITFSPDGNSIPELLPDLIAKFKEGYDMVIVSRYLGTAKSEDDDLVTAFGNWLFTATVNWLFKSNYTDVMVIYRAYKTTLIRDLKLDDDKGFTVFEKLFRCKISWEPALSARAARRKLQVGEIPGDEPVRIGNWSQFKEQADYSSRS